MLLTNVTFNTYALMLLALSEDILALNAVRFDVVAFDVVNEVPIALLKPSEPVEIFTVLTLVPLALPN